MKWLFVLMFVLTSSMALAEEVSTDCPWANQDGRNAGKNIRSTASTQTKTKGTSVTGQ